MGGTGQRAAGREADATAKVGPITECERVPFEPSIEVQPSTRSAESPTGLEVSLRGPAGVGKPVHDRHIEPQEHDGHAAGRDHGEPVARGGLGACTPAQYEAETASSLPGGAARRNRRSARSKSKRRCWRKRSRARSISPRLMTTPNSATPNIRAGRCSRCISSRRTPQRGIIIKVAGKIDTEPRHRTARHDVRRTRRQQPFSKFTLKFRPGATAPLVSPPRAAPTRRRRELTPWSAPNRTTLHRRASRSKSPRASTKAPAPRVVSHRSNRR